MIRVLYVSGGILNNGGITAYMLNYYRYFDRSKVQIDFVEHGGIGPFDDEIRSLGGRVFHVPTKRENLIKNRFSLMHTLKNYKIVHSHMDGMNGYILEIAKKVGVPIRISHSHNTEHLTNSKLKILIHEHYRKLIPKVATDLWSCSNEAGKWLYGNNEFMIVPNAIEVERYAFDHEIRKELRRKYKCDDSYVIGCVGRLDYQKNHIFLLDIFARAKSEADTSIKLVLIGDGDRRNDIEEKIRSLGLERDVIMVGNISNVNEYLNMLDIFVMPSYFEGFGIAALEAQANGLRCICSTGVPTEVNISDQIDFIELSNKKRWISALINRKIRDEGSFGKLVHSKYNIKQSAAKLQQLYMEREAVVK